MATRDILSILRVQTDDPELCVAQYSAFSKQMPLMYFILIVNTWGVASTHFDIAPLPLTFYIPLVLTVMCSARIAYWWFEARGRYRPKNAIANLKTTTLLAWILAGCFAAWGLALSRYGDTFSQSHVAFYMGITVIGCIFCFSHLLSAAIAITLVVNVAIIANFGFTGNKVFIAMAVDVALVSTAMMLVLWVQNRDFKALIASKRSLSALNDQNMRLANLDSLTGLANRRRFFAELDKVCCKTPPDMDGICVGLIDLDGFKPVNDLHGHHIGDDLLVEVGRRLMELRCGDMFVARLGGDEFAYLVRSGEMSEALQLGEEICDALRQPYAVGDRRIVLSASIGIAAGRGHEDTNRSLYERADFALYESKRERVGKPTVFSSDHSRSLSRLLAMERSFSSGSFEQELSLAYQPIVDLEHGGIVGFEALARWHHCDLGQISPGEFIPAAERLGYIGQMTKILLSIALADASSWPEHVRLSFNLSARDFSSSEQAMHLLAMISASSIAPARIDLEITETAILSDVTQAKAAARMYKAAGVGISLDDFGTGYSSLTHLHSMPLDKIKIDRSFIDGLDRKAASAKIVKSMIRMCKEMKIGCVVEGVETESQLQAIRKMGGRLIQGYQISKPVMANQASLMVATTR